MLCAASAETKRRFQAIVHIEASLPQCHNVDDVREAVSRILTQYIACQNDLCRCTLALFCVFIEFNAARSRRFTPANHFFLSLSRVSLTSPNFSIQISLDLAEHLVMILKDNNHRIVLLGVSCLRQISAHLQHISKPLLKYARRAASIVPLKKREFTCYRFLFPATFYACCRFLRFKFSSLSTHHASHSRFLTTLSHTH